MKKVQTYTPVIHDYGYGCYRAEMEPDSSAEWVRYKDYKELSEYADTLAQGLPCLPKDVEDVIDELKKLLNSKKINQ